MEYLRRFNVISGTVLKDYSSGLFRNNSLCETRANYSTEEDGGTVFLVNSVQCLKQERKTQSEIDISTTIRM